MKAIENRQANLQTYQHIRIDRREPLINLLYQSTKLYNDLKAQERMRLEHDMRQKDALRKTMQRNALNTRRRR